MRTCRASVDGNHVVNTRGICVQCGEQVDPYDAMEARARLRGGDAVRRVGWPPGVHARRDGDSVRLFDGSGKPIPADAVALGVDDLLGDWEDFNG